MRGRAAHRTRMQEHREPQHPTAINVDRRGAQVEFVVGRLYAGVPSGVGLAPLADALARPLAVEGGLAPEARPLLGLMVRPILGGTRRILGRIVDFEHA